MQHRSLSKDTGRKNRALHPHGHLPSSARRSPELLRPVGLYFARLGGTELSNACAGTESHTPPSPAHCDWPSSFRALHGYWFGRRARAATVCAGAGARTAQPRSPRASPAGPSQVSALQSLHPCLGHTPSTGRWGGGSGSARVPASAPNPGRSNPDREGRALADLKPGPAGLRAELGLRRGRAVSRRVHQRSWSRRWLWTPVRSVSLF